MMRAVRYPSQRRFRPCPGARTTSASPMPPRPSSYGKSVRDLLSPRKGRKKGPRDLLASPPKKARLVFDATLGKIAGVLKSSVNPHAPQSLAHSATASSSQLPSTQDDGALHPTFEIRLPTPTGGMTLSARPRTVTVEEVPDEDTLPYTAEGNPASTLHED